MKVTLISVDLAKDVFQVAGFTDRLKEVLNRHIKRKDLLSFMAQLPAFEVVMEARYSSHYWARCFQKIGYRVRLLPAQHVTPFVRGNKSDHNDTVATAEASRRPNILLVPIKTTAQRDSKSSSYTRSLCSAMYGRQRRGTFISCKSHPPPISLLIMPGALYEALETWREKRSMRTGRVPVLWASLLKKQRGLFSVEVLACVKRLSCVAPAPPILC